MGLRLRTPPPAVALDPDYLTRSEFFGIIPTERIAWWPQLITGTLNFFPRYARWLIRLGYKDALNTIRDQAYRSPEQRSPKSTNEP